MTSFDFSFSRFTFLVVEKTKKLNFLIKSNFRQVPNILIFLSSCTRPTSFTWLSGRTLSLLRLECSREEECLVRAKNFSARNPQLFFFFFLINGSSKESKPPEAHPRVSFLRLLLLPMTCVNPFELFFTDSFFFFSSTKSPCGNLDYLTGHCLHEPMSSNWKLSEKV